MECPQNDLTCAPWAKCFVNGPLPCSNSLSGNIFLFVIYSFLIMCGVKLVNDSGESLLRLVNSDSAVGRPVVALFVPVLHVLPELLIVLFASADSFQPQEQLWIAIGTIVGGVMFWLTIGWGLVMFVGRSDISSGEALDGKLTDKRDLVNTGVTVDLNTRQVAGIMTVSVALFTIAQVTDFVFRHESLQDMADSQHIYMLISAILCVLFYLAFTAYLFFNSSLQHRHLREARRRRRVDGAKARFVAKLDQVPLEQWLALADRELPQNWEHEVESLESTSLQTGSSTEAREQIHNSAQLALALRVVLLLLAGLLLLGLFTNPLVDTIMKFFRQNTDNSTVSVHHLQFYVSCFLLPFITNIYHLFENLAEAQHRQRKTISLIMTSVYTGVILRASLLLGILFSFIYFRGGLAWEFATETLVGVVLIIMVGLVSSIKTTFPMFWSLLAILCYPIFVSLIIAMHAFGVE